MADNIELMALVADLLSSKDLSRKSIGSEIKRLTSKQDKELAALREAGEKMAEIYTHLPKELRNEPNVYYQILLSGKEATELMAALAKWEAANK